MVAKNLIRSPNLASLLILAMAEPTYAGAWTLQRGHVWAEFYWQQYRADHDFDRSGQRTRMANGGEFREFRNEFKVESAPPWWADRFNVVGSLPIEYARYIDRNVTLTNRGAEEATVAAKWSMNEVGAAVIVAVQAGVRFPGCDASDQPPLADCQTDVEGRVILSRGLITDAEGVITAYASGEIGYRMRRAAPTDEVPFFVEAASRLGRSPFWLKGFLDGAQRRARRMCAGFDAAG